jgi:hypothetical protein
MSVRAKFKVNKLSQPETTKLIRVDGKDECIPEILRTVELVPVYDPDPESENGKFFAYTPAGKIELGTIHGEAAEQFELGKEYYVDFTPA